MSVKEWRNLQECNQKMPQLGILTILLMHSCQACTAQLTDSGQSDSGQGIYFQSREQNQVDFLEPTGLKSTSEDMQLSDTHRSNTSYVHTRFKRASHVHKYWRSSFRCDCGVFKEKFTVSTTFSFLIFIFAISWRVLRSAGRRSWPRRRQQQRKRRHRIGLSMECRYLLLSRLSVYYHLIRYISFNFFNIEVSFTKGDAGNVILSTWRKKLFHPFSQHAMNK